MRSVFLTGASGFIGRRLASVLVDEFSLRQAFRTRPEITPSSDYIVCDFNDEAKLALNLENIDVVIHCAGYAHVIDHSNKCSKAICRENNVELTLRLARAAITSGVKRFIFLSSIGVNGRTNTSAFTEQDIPNPEEDYAKSKLIAEQELQKLLFAAGVELVIIRPPLVYGPGVKANFFNMMKWLYKGIPLPFGAIHNKRSFVALDNLVDLLMICIEHPNAANQIFLAGDGEDLSTSELLNKITLIMGKRSHLLPVNQKILNFFFRLMKQNKLQQRLCGSLQVDISKSKDLLNWVPPISVDEGLQQTVKYFLRHN